MASEGVARPRTLSAIFGVYFLLMAIIAWYSGQTLGYVYTASITQFSFTVYLMTGAIFLVGLAAAAVLGARSLDARIDRLEGVQEAEEEYVEEVVVEETSDEVPPPLPDPAPAAGDHVDRDIDELLVSLQEMEQDAGTSEAPEETEPSAAPRTVARAAPRSVDARLLAKLKRKRAGIAAYFAGPCLAAVGTIGLSAAMLPGSDGLLQSSPNLNTALLLGLGYSFVGLAAYVAGSVLLLVRQK